jgi:hypothetical protein
MKKAAGLFLLGVSIIPLAHASQLPPGPICAAKFRVVACAKVEECALDVITPPALVEDGLQGKGCPFKEGDQITPVFVKAAPGEIMDGTVQWGGDEWGSGYNFISRIK